MTVPISPQTRSVSWCALFLLFVILPEYNLNEQRHWVVGIIWIVERILSKVRSRHITYISNILERHGATDQKRRHHHQNRSIYLPYPEVSWHLFTLTR